MVHWTSMGSRKRSNDGLETSVLDFERQLARHHGDVRAAKFGPPTAGSGGSAPSSRQTSGAAQTASTRFNAAIKGRREILTPSPRIPSWEPPLLQLLVSREDYPRLPQVKTIFLACSRCNPLAEKPPEKLQWRHSDDTYCIII